MATAWNKGKHLPLEYRKKISASMSNRKLSKIHKKRIAISQKKRIAQIKICSNCNVKSKWMYGVIMPRITYYMAWLCDNCMLLYFRSGEKIEVIA